jgi:hypothetical protein
MASPTAPAHLRTSRSCVRHRPRRACPEEVLRDRLVLRILGTKKMASRRTEASGKRCADAPCDDGILALAVSSSLIAVALDAALIANEDVPLSKPTLSIVPSVDPRSRRAALNVVGAF